MMYFVFSIATPKKSKSIYELFKEANYIYVYFEFLGTDNFLKYKFTFLK